VVVFVTHGTSVSARSFVNMTTEQGGEGPFPTHVHIRLLGDIRWTKGITYPPFAKAQALIGDRSEAQKERISPLRQTRSKIEGMQCAEGF
jgi:hypothetical protein